VPSFAAGFMLDTDPDKFIEMQDATLVQCAEDDARQAREDHE
jgi:hypothetical protein